MTNRLRPYIDHLAVPKVEQQEVVERLPPVPGMNRICGFELKKAASADQRINK